MSRAGIGSGAAAASSGSRGGSAASSSRHYERSTAEIHAAFVEDPQDHISASLDAEFEGGQFINGEFFYTAKKARRHMSKAEQIYGFDEEADREFYAQHSQPKKRAGGGNGKIPGGIAFVLGATLQPEINAKQQREKEAAEAAAAAAKKAAVIEDGPIAMDESEDVAEESVSFQALRQAKTAASAPSGRTARQRERDEEDEAERSMAGRGGGLGFQPSSSSAAAPSPAAVTARPPPAKVDKDFGAFNKHGTGFGLRMLAKSGFRPGDRLGKHGQGVVNPIAARLRPATMGLGFGNFKEVDKNNMARNAKEEQEMELAKQEEKKAKQAEQEAKAQAGWKKEAAGGKSNARNAKPKRVYKTAAEVLAGDTQQVGGAPTPLVIMDYRGATAKVTSLDQVSSVVEPEVAAGPAPQMLPELQHNLRLLVSMAEDELRTIERDRKASSQRMDQLMQQKEQIESSVEYEEQRILVLEQIVSRIDEAARLMASISKSAPNSLRLRIEIAVAMLRALRSQYPQEYALYEIPQRSLAMVYPLIKGLLYNWEPLAMPAITSEEKMSDAASSNSSHLPVLELLSQFKPLLSSANASSVGPSRGSLYQQLLEELLLPKLRLELSNPQSCSIKTHVSSIVAMLRRIQPVCTPEVYLHVTTQLVYPQLKHEVGLWNPRVDPMPVHEWVLPYTAFVPDDLLAKLYDAIRLKLSITLQEWNALDHSAIHVISPWANRFRAEQFDNLMQRSILPKLQQMLRQSLHINPAKQDLAPFLALLPWSNLAATLPPSTSAASAATLLRNLVIQEFFPKWFAALYTWLGGATISVDTPSIADFDEVSAWYRGWKSQFPPALLADPLVQQCFSKGLDLMNQAMSEQPIHAMYQQVTHWLQAPTTVMTQQAHQPTRVAAPPAPVLPSAASMALDGAEGDAEFVSVILQFASHHGVEFVPHLKKAPVNGKQVYLFGRAQVYVSKGVVYTRKEGASAAAPWTPISLADLLEQTKQTMKPDETTAAAKPARASARRQPAAAPAAAAPNNTEDVD